MEAVKKRGLFSKFLDVVEKVGNKLPDPVTLFILFALVVVGTSVTSVNWSECN